MATRDLGDLRHKVLHGDPLAAFAAFKELAMLGSQALPVLVEALTKHPEPTMRAAAAGALEALGPQARTVLTEIKASAKDPDFGVRTGVSGALASIDDPSALDALVQMLGDPEPPVVFCVVYHLAELGAKAQSALPSIKTFLSHHRDNRLVHDAILSAMRTIEERSRIVPSANDRQLPPPRIPPPANIAMVRAVALYETRKISSGAVARLAEVDRIEFMFELSRHRVSPMDLDVDEIARDSENA